MNPADINEFWDDLLGHGDWVYSVAFSPDNKRIISGSQHKKVRLWEGPDSWPGLACTKLNCNLSKNEWRLYIPGLPYAEQCPGLPFPGLLTS